MKVIWLCSMIPGPVREKLDGRTGGALWVEHVLSDIRQRENTTLRLLCPGQEGSGQLDQRTSYALFREGKAYVYSSRLEEWFTRELEAFSPDVIHIWGTEYGHSLAMVNAAKNAGMEKRTVISIQGLCGIYARHYCEGLPHWVCRRSSFRDFLRQDNVLRQQHKFELRGKLERVALERTCHVIGRTDWDRAITQQYNPNVVYHFCNETLRQCFYQGIWRYHDCKKHRIFISSCLYPLKGFHYLLEAFETVLTEFPDATICVPGQSIFPANLEQRIRQEYYCGYMERFCRERGLTDKITFLGTLSAEQMKAAFLEANVFVMPSTIENSPNSLGEAMLLGVPCVAADVGGVSNLLHPGEGYVYQSTAPYMLAHYIMEVFRQQDKAEQMGRRASSHARQTHDPEKNMEALLSTYREIAGKE